MEKRQRVVCVDDDPLVQARVAAALGGRFEVVEAWSGEAGLEALAEGGADWVVLDYHLGDMNGGQFLLAAHGTGARPGYILLSGAPISRLDWEGLRPLGVRGSLQKPLETDFLLALLETGGRLRGAPVGGGPLDRETRP